MISFFRAKGGSVLCLRRRQTPRHGRPYLRNGQFTGLGASTRRIRPRRPRTLVAKRDAPLSKAFARQAEGGDCEGLTPDRQTVIDIPR